MNHILNKLSAGLLMFRKQNDALEFFLVHPGGPFYIKKNDGVWSIPKGIPEEGELLENAAAREFFEETGIKPSPPFFSLDTVKLKSGKVIHAWAFSGNWNPEHGIVSNYFDLEWPPRSGKFIKAPEVDRAEWMNFNEAIIKIHPAQIPFIERASKLFN